MHPIERLRAIARSEDLPHAELASEAAAALAGLAGEPLGLVPACRRLLDRHPEVGPLWWTCARMLAAHDAGSEAWQIESDLAADQAGLSLALDVPDGDITVAVLGGSPLVDELCARRPDLRIEKHVGGAAFERDLLLVEAWAAGDRASLAPAGAEDAVEAARRAGKEAWLVVGVGRRLPGPLFTALRRRVDRRVDPGTIDFDHGPEQVDTNQFTRIVEPLEIACPCPPELLKGDP